MSDDKSNRGAQDRARVAGGQKHEVTYEASKSGKSPQAVRDAIKKVGPMRKSVGKALRQGR